MKSLALLAFAAAAAGFAVANAEIKPITPPSRTVNAGGGGGWGGGYHSSTAAEGAMRGMGSLVRSQGQANLDNSAAAINYSAARRNEIENRKIATDTYFEMRQANKDYRAAERRPRPKMEDLVRYAQAGKPKRLSPSELDIVTGRINWPKLLLSDKFAAERGELEEAFSRRASESTSGVDGYTKIGEATKAMLAELKEQVRQVPPSDYMVAKRFLESLAYEARYPTS